MKFLHLSDLHIHTNAVDNQGASDVFKYISKNYPDHKLIITGDVVDDGTEKQYANAFAMLQPFKDRVFICPGNHDFGAVGNFYSQERAERFDDVLAKGLNQGGTFKGDSTPVVNVLKENGLEIMLIALDSNLETENFFDFACGEIGESQINALSTLLSTTPNVGTVKVLFFHHHPFMINDPFMELKDAKALARAVYNRVDLILFGHKHEMREYKKQWGTQYTLASDNSPGKAYAKEITIDGKGISVKPVLIGPKPRK